MQADPWMQAKVTTSKFVSHPHPRGFTESGKIFSTKSLDPSGHLSLPGCIYLVYTLGLLFHPSENFTKQGKGLFEKLGCPPKNKSPRTHKMSSSSLTGKVYIVEHLDPELGPWSELEYIAIAEESQNSGSSFTLSSLPAEFKVPESLKTIPTFKPTQESVEDIYAGNKDTVCLLDPSAEKDLSPEDAQEFSAFLFGGILGKTNTIVHSYTNAWLTIIGDDPPRGNENKCRASKLWSHLLI